MDEFFTDSIIKGTTASPALLAWDNQLLGAQTEKLDRVLANSGFLVLTSASLLCKVTHVPMKALTKTKIKIT